MIILTGALEVAARRGVFAPRIATNLSYSLAPDDPLAGYEVARRGLEASKAAGAVWSIRYLLGNAMTSAIEVGEWDWALEEAADLDALFTEPAERMWFGALTSVIRLLRGEDLGDGPRRLYEESRGVDDAQFRVLGAFALQVQSFLDGAPAETTRLTDVILGEGLAGIDAAVYGARSAIWHGNLASARRMRDAFERASPGRRNAALRTTMDAGIAMLEGRAPEARASFAQALDEWRELGGALWLGLTDLDIVITGAMEPDERRRAAAEARETFTKLGARALLDRLDAALAEAGGSISAPAPVREAREIGQEA